MNHEQFAPSETPANSFPRIGEKMFANMIQIRLGQIAYEVTHGEVPDMKNHEVKNAVLMEWADKYAASFREYLNNHPQETLDINDEESLFRLFEKLTPEQETAH